MEGISAGPWKAIQIYGWGDEPCILQVGETKPLAKLIRPKSYHTEYVKRTGENGETYTVLSEQKAREAGNYVPPKGHREEVKARQWRDAHLIAAAPEMYEALQEACTSLVIAADQARDAAKTDSRWSGVDEKLMRYAREGQAVLAKARGET